MRKKGKMKRINKLLLRGTLHASAILVKELMVRREMITNRKHVLEKGNYNPKEIHIPSTHFACPF